jgi:hypothetical protein
MASQRCPVCNGVLPPELGQHSLAPMSGLVTCPHCGSEVKLEKPAEDARKSGGGRAAEGDVVGADQGGPDESFSGHESAQGAMDEIEKKPGGASS